jgi:hypothetical protein
MRFGVEHAFDHPSQPGRGLGQLVDVHPLGERAAVGVAQLGGDDAGRFAAGWEAEILAFHRTEGCSNGPTEAVNPLIKKVKRVGHGFRIPTAGRLGG